MIPYLLPIVFCLVAIYHFDISGNRRQRLLCYALLSTYLVLLSGFSYRVGSDSGFYEDSFRSIPTLAKVTVDSYYDSPYQPLYFLLCVVCKSVVPDFWFMHLCQSWIVCTVMFGFIRKRTDHLFSGALLFILCIYPYFCFEILKESLAVCMVLLGYPYLEQKKYLKFYLFAALALSFHFSGAVAFFLPFMRGIRFDRKFFIWVVVALCCVKLLEYVAPYVLLGDMTAEKFDYYVHVATERYNENWFLVSFFRNVLIPAIAGLWLKWTYGRLPFEWAFCIYVLLGLGTLEYALIFERPINYFLPFVAVSLGELLGRSFRRGLSRHAATVVVCMVFWLGCRGLFYMRSEGWRILIPYESIFTERVDAKREKVIYYIH